MEQFIKHGFTCNLEADIRRSMDFLPRLGTYHHLEIITYGNGHERSTYIINYEPTKDDTDSMPGNGSEE
jgi:hypothetical protein